MPIVDDVGVLQGSQAGGIDTATGRPIATAAIRRSGQIVDDMGVLPAPKVGPLVDDVGILRTAGSYAARIGLPIAGGIVGGIPGALAGGLAGEAAGQYLAGERFNPELIAAEGLFSILPGGKAVSGVARNLFKRGAVGALYGGASEVPREYLRSGKIATPKQIATGAAVGAGFGATLGGIEGAVRGRGTGNAPPVPAAPPAGSPRPIVDDLGILGPSQIERPPRGFGGEPRERMTFPTGGQQGRLFQPQVETGGAQGDLRLRPGIERVSRGTPGAPIEGLGAVQGGEVLTPVSAQERAANSLEEAARALREAGEAQGVRPAPATQPEPRPAQPEVFPAESVRPVTRSVADLAASPEAIGRVSGEVQGDVQFYRQRTVGGRPELLPATVDRIDIQPRGDEVIFRVQDGTTTVHATGPDALGPRVARLRSMLERRMQTQPAVAAAVIPPGSRQPVRGKLLTGPSGGEVEAFGIADPSQRYRFRYRAVPLDEPTVNAPEVQPRDRARATSQAQVDQLERNFDPERFLAGNEELDRGVPIVGPDGLVESGNARMLAVRQLRDQDPARFAQLIETQKARAGEFGLRPEDIGPDSLIVRERVSEVPDRLAFADEANARTALAQAPVELAGRDAVRLKPEDVTALQIGESQSVEQALSSPRNKQVIGKFLATFPQNERAGLVTAEAGQLNPSGVQRIKAALLARTYTGEAGQRLLRAATESTDSNVKNIEAAIFGSLGKMTKAMELVRAGNRAAGLDITDDIATAVQTLSRLRSSGQRVDDYLRQGSLAGRELSPFAESLLDHFDTAGRSQLRMRRLLEGMADEIIAAPEPGQKGLFGAQEVTPDAIFTAALRRSGEVGLFGEVGGPGARRPPPGPRGPVRPAVKPPPQAPPEGAERAAPPEGPVLYDAQGRPLSPLTRPLLREEHHQTVVRAAGELFRRGGVERNPQRLLSDQIVDMVHSGRLTVPELQETLTAHKVTLADFTDDLFRPAIRDAAQRLQRLSALAQSLNRLDGSDALSRIAEQLERDAIAVALPWWRRVDNIRRGLLVSQLSTAVRNAEAQAGRVGLDVAQQALDAGLQWSFGVRQRTHALDGLETVWNLFRRNTTANVDAILEQFPDEHDRLFGIWNSDIATGTAGRTRAERIFDNADKAVAVVNTVNRAQEFLFRRAVFQAKLGQALRERGQSLDQVNVKDIPEGAIRDAVDEALSYTFAKSPKFGSLGQKFVSLVNALPGATLAIPFPRFLVNSLKFFSDFSPTGFLKLLSPAERTKIAGGDTSTISRAVLGTGMLGAAFAIRSSEYAGERWYELRTPDGSTIDTRAFNPFAAYLFTADVIRRKIDGRLNTLTAKDMIAGVLSSNLRAGTGLYLVDQVLGALTEAGSAEKAGRMLAGLAGETLAGFATPIQQLTDALAEYDDELQVIRETRMEPFAGPIKAKIPGLAQTLPEAESPTRGAPMRRGAPLLKQLTGILLSDPKNPVERELDRLGFTRQEVLPSSGDPEVDRLVAQKMGPLAERRLGFLVTSGGYHAMSDAAKGNRLREGLIEMRQRAREEARGRYPQRFHELKRQQQPRRLRQLLEERRSQ